MGRPTYIVFDETYAVPDIARLLGVVVCNTCRPLDTTTTPLVESGQKLDFVDKYMLTDRRESDITIKTSAIRKTAAEFNLVSIFGLSADSWITDKYDLTTKDVHSITPQHHDAVFRELMEAHGDSVRALFRSGRAANGAYMLVGFKTAAQPKVERSTERGKKHAGEVSSKGVSTALGSPVPVDVSASVNREISREAYITSVAADDRAFAGQYVRLEFKIDGVSILQNGRISVKRRVIEKGVAHPTSDQLAFAGDSGSEENSDEEDSSEAANESPILV